MNIIKINLFKAMFAPLLIVAMLVPAFTQAQSADELLRTIQSLQAQIADLEGSSSSVGSRSGGSNACPYTWSRNLVIGSRGEDVRQLQRFLNDDSDTVVSNSGVGSKGSETVYYGPATAAAVSKFQEKYSSEILERVGLSRGTGSFYSLTRAKANAVCATKNPIVINTRPIGPDVVSGGLKIADGDVTGRQIEDGYAIAGAKSVPFTTFTLTAGSQDVVVDGVVVRSFGLAGDDGFESVALTDANGIQLGKARSLNSDSEATIGGRFEIPRGKSLSFAVVGNVDLQDGTSGLAGLAVVEVNSNASELMGLSSSTGLRGAVHVFSDAITLQTIDVKWSGSTSTDNIELNKLEEVADFELEVDTTGGADEENWYLKSITFDQDGDIDSSDIGQVVITLDGREEYTGRDIYVNGDSYTIVFDDNGGKGFFVEEDDDLEVVIEVESTGGTGDKVQFGIEDVTDVLVVGEKYGYGLPVVFNGGGSSNDEVYGVTYTVTGGDVRGSSRVSLFDRNDFDISYGSDVILGAYEFEVEGEDLDFDTAEFSVEISGLSTDTSNTPNTFTGTDGVEELEISGIYLELYEEGDNSGTRVARADEDIVFDADDVPVTNVPATATAEEIVAGTYKLGSLEFTNSFTIEESRNEYTFVIRGDLDSDWSEINGAKIEFTLKEFDEIEGRDSEDDYDQDSTFNDVAFESVDIEGNEVDFKLSDSDIDQDEYVSDAENVAFGTFEVDADDAIDDIELDSFKVYALANNSGSKAEVENLEDCIIVDSGDDEVAELRSDVDSSDSSETNIDTYDLVEFKFDNNVIVEAGTEEEFTIVCDIDNDAVTGDVYWFAVSHGSDKDGEVEYQVGRDDFVFTGFSASEDSERVSITGAGTLSVTVDRPSGVDAEYALGVNGNGATVEVVDFEVEAENEDITIREILIDDVELGLASGYGNAVALSDVLQSVRLTSIGGSDADLDDLETDSSYTYSGLDSNNWTIVNNAIVFEDVDEEVRADDQVEFSLEFEFAGMDKDTDQNWSAESINIGKIIVVWEGDDSNTVAVEEQSISSSDYGRPYVYDSIPVITTNNRERSLSNGKQTLYEFDITAESESGNDSGEVYVKKLTFQVDLTGEATLAAGSFRVEEGGSSLGTSAAAVSSSGEVSVELTESLRIDEGSTKTLAVTATVVSAAGGNDSIVVYLENDDSATVLKGDAYADLSSAKFVWSPNGRDGDGELTVEDWFSGRIVIDGSDIESWDSNND